MFFPLKLLIMRFFVSGDSFVVNACLARKGIDDWLVKQKYYCTSSRLEQRDCHHKNNCGLAARVSTTRFMSFLGKLLRALDELAKDVSSNKRSTVRLTALRLISDFSPHMASLDKLSDKPGWSSLRILGN